MSVVPLCRFCSTPLNETFVDLGEQPVANSFILAADIPSERKFPLHAKVCPSCLLVQLDHTVPADAIFSHDYAYFSSYSTSWVEHAKRYADAMIERLALGPQSLVVEAASNDGYLLQHFKARGVDVLGVEPTSNTAEAAIAKGIPTEIAFFNEATATRLVEEGKRADLIAANNVLAHVPDTLDFVRGFTTLLKLTGIATFEFPHLLNLIRDVQFDTIYHEHYFFLSLYAVEQIFDRAGLKVVDVEELPTHGGSLRVYAARKDSSAAASPSVAAMRAKEKSSGLDTIDGYRGFDARVRAVAEGFSAFLKKARADNKKVAAYGAAAKGNTFLNYCGVRARDIDCVFDVSLAKQGKLLPGSHIPVIAPERLAEIRPDYLVILPWNLAEEIMSKNSVLRSWGGQFVIAVPEIKLLP
jgi:SAM-dependent methyltransferase